MDVDSAGPLDGILKYVGIVAIIVAIAGVGLWYFNRPTGYVPLSAEEGILPDSPLSTILGSPPSDNARSIVLSNQRVQMKLLLDSFEWETVDANVSLSGTVVAHRGEKPAFEAEPGTTQLSLFSGSVRWNNPDLFLAGKTPLISRDGFKIKFLSDEDLALKAENANAALSFTEIDSLKKKVSGSISSNGVSIDLNGVPLDIGRFRGSVSFSDGWFFLDGNAEKIVIHKEG